jgi:hypothetical protein
VACFTAAEYNAGTGKVQIQAGVKEEDTMKKLALVTGTLMILVFAQSAAAAEGTGEGGPASVGAKIGTLGIGIGGEYRLSESFGLGLGANYFKYDFDFTAEEITYDAELNLASATVLAHYYPMKSRFRLTGGLAFNGNEIDAQSQGDASYEIGDTTYTAAQVGTIDGKIDFRSVAPYLGLGWGPSMEKRWGFTFDIGVLFQGSPDVELTASGLLAQDPVFLADLAEEEQAIQDELEKFQYYPIIALGVYYRF